MHLEKNQPHTLLTPQCPLVIILLAMSSSASAVSSSFSPSAKRNKLQLHVRKALAEIIEENGGIAKTYGQEQFLRRILDERSKDSDSPFGHWGDPIRRKLQQQVNYWQKLNKEKKYVEKVLYDLGVQSFANRKTKTNTKAERQKVPAEAPDSSSSSSGGIPSSSSSSESEGKKSRSRTKKKGSRTKKKGPPKVINFDTPQADPAPSVSSTSSVSELIPSLKSLSIMTDKTPAGERPFTTLNQLTCPSSYGVAKKMNYTTRKSTMKYMQRILVHSAVEIQDIEHEWVSPRKFSIRVAWPDFMQYPEQMAGLTKDLEGNVVYPPEHPMTEDTAERTALLVEHDTNRIWNSAVLEFEQNMVTDNPEIELLNVPYNNRQVRVIQIQFT